MTRAELRRVARELGWRGNKTKRRARASREVQEAFRQAVQQKLAEEKAKEQR